MFLTVLLLFQQPYVFYTRGGETYDCRDRWPAIAAFLLMNFSQVLSRRFPNPTVLGTTVSAPVYDFSKTPPLFLGVVGIDFTLKALDAALGINDDTSAESFRRMVEQHVKQNAASCPQLELTACELESYRRQTNTGGNDNFCNVNCTVEDIVQVVSCTICMCCAAAMHSKLDCI